MGIYVYRGADDFNKLDLDGDEKADLAIGEWADNVWVKADGLETRDGWYRYFKKVEEKDDDQKLTPLFRSVNVGQYTSSNKEVEVPDIVVKSAAVQADNVDEETAFETVKDIFK